MTTANPLEVKRALKLMDRFVVSSLTEFNCKASGAGRMKNSVAMANPTIIM